MPASAHTRAAAFGGRGRVLGVAAFAAVWIGATASASGPVVHTEPGGPLPVGTSTLSVAGSGFDPVGNSGNGIYVAFGPITPAPAYYLDPTIYAAIKWVHPGGSDSGAEAPMAADGSFATTLEVPSSFGGLQRPVDCNAVPCAVITFGAHGSQDRTQDTCTAVTFLAAAPSGLPSPAASLVAGGVALPSSEPAPSGSGSLAGPAASPMTGDPCDAIGAAPGA